MPIANSTLRVSVTDYLNLPVTTGIDNTGHWYVYSPANVNNNALGANVKIYRWGQELDTLYSGNVLTMQGTFPLVTEVWESANVKYHGGAIEWVGQGINNITSVVENDAFFFSHLGTRSTSPVDDAFYWDRAYLEDGVTTWDYYQYHKHLPTNYVRFEDGRMVLSAGSYISPEDKAFGYLISTRARVSGTDYNSVMARIHTPSIGGAHNSHNDVTLPTVGDKNYMPGGILKGVGDRFHCFYITQSASDWTVYNRTYTKASGSFTVEVNLGDYDLADPTFNPVENTGVQSQYPLRASCGAVFGTRFYFPVIFNGTGGKYDLKIWSFNSGDTVAGGSLLQYTLVTNANVRPDCYLTTVGNKLYAVNSNIAGGGVDLQIFNGTSWANNGPVVTNSNTKHVRVHGFEYNSEDVKYYLTLSGTALGGGTYTGPGLYSFDLAETFTGYKHLDYDVATNSFINRDALATGHIQFSQTDGVLTRISAPEPQGISSGTNILEYVVSSPNFFNKIEASLGGEEYYYHGTTLNDGRKLLVGRISGLSYGKGGSDLFVSVYDGNGKNPRHFAWGGDGDDYITGLYEDGEKVWITGYTKSELVERKEIKVHGFCRNLRDAPALLQWTDSVVEASGNIFAVGYSDSGTGLIAKYDSNYELEWQYTLSEPTSIITINAIAEDSTGNLYTTGKIQDEFTNEFDTFLTKFNKQGNLIYGKTFTTTGNCSTSGIAIVSTGSQNRIILPIVNENNTTFVVTDTNGNITEQNFVTNLIVNKVRTDSVNKFIFAGNDGQGGTKAAKFGLCNLSDNTGMVKWTRTYGGGATPSDANDIQVFSTGNYAVVGSDGSNGFILKANVTNDYTVTKTWAKNFANSSINATVIIDSNVYAVGYTTTSNVAEMGMDDSLLVRLDSSGNVIWQNVFGHDMDERFLNVTKDPSEDNIISVGWSESHSNARDTILFRSWVGGFGTGTYHREANPGVPYFYTQTTLANTINSSSLSVLSAPANSVGNIAVNNSLTYTMPVAGATSTRYDGSFGKDGVFMFFFGYIDLKAIQNYLNTDAHIVNGSLPNHVDYTKDIFVFKQVGTVGDATADDGNIFGYDIIKGSDGKIYIIGQTSGDVRRDNPGTSGVYDYVLFVYDPNTDELEIYQNGTNLDEETYALTELSDGTIAFVGRTTGNLGNPNLGGYDIFLGIYNPSNDSFRYYSTGTGFDDRGVNVHDLGSNTLAVVYHSYGAVGNNTINYGSEDIGVILFDYNTNNWGNAYQTGSATSEIFEQNGKPSALLPDGRIAIVASTAGIFADDAVTFSGLDIGLGIVDVNTGTWNKYQVGSGTNDIVSSVTTKGDRLLIAGHSEAAWQNPGNAIWVEFDAQLGVGGKAAFE